MATISDKQWQKIKKAYLDGGESYASLAIKFKVGKRTIEQRAATEGWKALKESQEIASQAIADKVTEAFSHPVPARGVRPHFESVSPEDIVRLALEKSYTDLEDDEVKPRNKGEVISSIEKMLKLQHQMSMYKYEIELKEIQIEKERNELILKQREVNPPTAKEWIIWAIHWGHDLRELWNAIPKVLGKE